MKKNKAISLIKSNGKCVGCNKCIRTCASIQGLVAQRTHDGKNRIKIDANKCIACGACYSVCEHNAIDYFDDTLDFINDLKNGEKISLLVAPSFFANYADNYGEILGGLKELGVNKIISVGFGADITTWGYIKYIKENNFKGGISQPCPSVVSYIEHYEPELITKIMPVQSPMMCSAIYARNEMGITEKLAFLGPCISKKAEQVSKRGKNIISYNVTFGNLLSYVRENNVYGKSVKDEIEHGIGTIYPISGGLKESVSWFLGENEIIRHVEGGNDVFDFFSKNKEYILGDENPYFFVDALNCDNGCSFGPANEESLYKDEKSLMELMKIRNSVKNSEKIGWTKFIKPQDRLDLLNEKFKNLDLSDYLCEYTDFSDCTKLEIPSETELEYIFHTMNKNTLADIEIQCSCCGYETCKDMAIAIHNGINIKENCVHYIKDTVEKERDRARKAEIFVELAMKDLQTGLFNRNAYYNWIDERQSFENCAVAIFDLNDLKKCNDTYGHEAGDKYIKKAVDIIDFVFKKVGKTFRIGGDEFCTVIEKVDVAKIEEGLKTIDTIINDHNSSGEDVFTMKVASGYAIFDRTLDTDFADTLRRADELMYKYKVQSKHNN